MGARLVDAPDHGGARLRPDLTRALAVETTFFSVCAAAWWIAHSHPTGVLELGLFALSAVALGIQSSTFHLVSGHPTTYLTGTVTTLIVRLARRRRDADDSRSRSWLALVGVIVGAALGALAARHATGWAQKFVRRVVSSDVLVQRE